MEIGSDRPYLHSKVRSHASHLDLLHFVLLLHPVHLSTLLAQVTRGYPPITVVFIVVPTGIHVCFVVVGSDLHEPLSTRYGLYNALVR